MGNCKSGYLPLLPPPSTARGICLAASSQRYRYEYTDTDSDAKTETGKQKQKHKQKQRQTRWPADHQTGTKASLEMVSKINATGK